MFGGAETASVSWMWLKLWNLRCQADRELLRGKSAEFPAGPEGAILRGFEVEFFGGDDFNQKLEGGFFSDSKKKAFPKASKSDIVMKTYS